MSLFKQKENTCDYNLFGVMKQINAELQPLLIPSYVFVGDAAMAVYGYTTITGDAPIVPRSIEVYCTRDLLQRIAQLAGVEIKEKVASNGKFRSRGFTVKFHGTDVDLFCSLQVKVGGCYLNVEIPSSTYVRGIFHVATTSGQMMMLGLLNREQDRKRLDLIRAWDKLVG